MYAQKQNLKSAEIINTCQNTVGGRVITAVSLANDNNSNVH